MLSGTDALTLAAPGDPATVRVSWTAAMGLRYPLDAELTGPPDDPGRVHANAAVGPAVTACRQALAAAARCAAAERAVTAVGAEVALTRRRMRTLDRRWLPWLRGALAGLELSFEQGEQEDGIRLRRARAAGRSAQP